MKRLLTGLGSAVLLAGLAASPANAAVGHHHPIHPVHPPIGQAAYINAAIARGESMIGTDSFGEYGCEDFVDAAYGMNTSNGMPHNGAREFYENLVSEGKGHSSLPAPRGALVFSAGEDGDHVDISLGNGKYLSGGVQGFAPGWGDGSDIQILPSANLGSWTLYGWAYAPWK